MTIAWYGHLKHTDQPLWRMIFISWLIAGVEYCFAVPANRIGYQTGFSAGQLKIMQEVVTLLVFAVFAVLWLGETLRWNHAAAFACMVGAVGFMFYDKL